MTSIGVLKSNQLLDISLFYEMSLFTNDEIKLPLPKIMCSNNNREWYKYDELKKNYMYLSDLMANYLKIETEQDINFSYNANLKK